MPDKGRIGHIIKELNSAFRRKFLACGMAAGLDEVTLMHGWIMGYLLHNQDREIYQKTIESEFNIGRSTVTAILQLMEKKGYIRREAVAEDARLKKICLTQQGNEIAVRTKAMILNMEADLQEGIPERDLEVFFAVAKKLLSIMDSSAVERSVLDLSAMELRTGKGDAYAESFRCTDRNV